MALDNAILAQLNFLGEKGVVKNVSNAAAVGKLWMVLSDLCAE